MQLHENAPTRKCYADRAAREAALHVQIQTHQELIMFRGNDWTDRYEIISIKGVYWTRDMVRRRVLDHGRRLGLPVDPTIVGQVLDDDAFMRQRRGLIPARVIEDVHEEARWPTPRAP